jgi:hypothetical protein
MAAMAEGSEIDDDAKARALARSILADIALYNREDIRAGRDMRSVFDDARLLYMGRVTARLHPVFDEEVRAFLERSSGSLDGPKGAHDKEALLKVGATVVLVGTLIVGMWTTTRTDGTKIRTVRLPGTTTFAVDRGDRLHFEANHDVYFRGETLEDEPDGCFVDMVLSQGTRELGRTRCDLFHTTATTVISDAENSEELPDGLTHLEVFEVRLACGFEIAAPGNVTLAMTTNLDTCVPRRGTSSVLVYRAHTH